MGYTELLERLDLEDASEFKYFENFAELMESEESLEADELAALFENTEKEDVLEIIENYFDEALEILQEHADIYTTIELIKSTLTRLYEEGAIKDFALELAKVQEWYAIIEEVEVTDYSSGADQYYSSILDAICNLRLEKLGDKKLEYDFYKSAEYEIEEYVMNIGTLESDGE